ncbi:MAG: glycoside hydrolase N-terminal domain-containing protein [Acidobacteriota bacterium]
MRLNRNFILTGIIFSFLFVSCCSTKKNSRFLPSADLNLLLEAPLKNWDEALPLGNGILGGLLWGEQDTIRISLDRGDLWDLRVPSRFSEPDFNWMELKKAVDARDMKRVTRDFDSFYNHLKYPTKLPGGRLEIKLGPDRKVEKFELALASATGKVYLNDGTRIDGFFSAVHPVAIFRIPGPEPESIKLIAPGAVNQLGYPEAETGGKKGEYWYLQKGVEKIEYGAFVSTRRIGDETIIALTICSSHDELDLLSEARRIVNDALDKKWENSFKVHREYWRDFWSKSRILIPDLNHLKHYYLVQYFYGAASRKGAPSIPLQGVWTADNGNLPPWHGDYHHDLNTQMTYEAYQTAGRFEAGECFLDHMYRLLPQFQKFAKNFYKTPGAAIPTVMTQEGEPMTGWVMYSLSPTNGAWVGWYFYKHWLYTRQAKDLERGYKFCSELGKCLTRLLEEDENGLLKLPLSSSPEIFDNSHRAFLKPNSNYDRDCMEALFRGLEHMAQEKGESAQSEKWRSVYQKFGPRSVDENNVLMYSSNEKMNYSHRHLSHSMAIHPFDMMTIDGTENEKKIIQSTVQQYDTLGTKAWVGYSFSWMSCLCARIGDSETAINNLDIYEKAFISKNGFHVNGDQLKAGYSKFQYRPFTLEGNFLASQAVHEMLLQSWHGIIRIFPATPERWQDAEFEKLRAEGGFKVSAKRKANTAVWIKIEATVDNKLRLLDNFGTDNIKWSMKGVVKEGNNFVFNMKKGDVLKAELSD